MSNINAPYGARLVGHRSGSPYNARIRPYITLTGDATPLFVGDFVVLVAASGTTSESGISLPACTQATAQSTELLGIVVGFLPDPASPYAGIFRPASQLRTAYVCDDPDALFEIQANGTVAITAAHYGSNAALNLVTSGETIFGLSGMTLDSNTIAATDNQLRIEGLSQRVNNTIGQYANLICSINDHIFTQRVGV